MPEGFTRKKSTKAYRVIWIQGSVYKFSLKILKNLSKPNGKPIFTFLNPAGILFRILFMYS